jgi:hypothetical protein
MASGDGRIAIVGMACRLPGGAHDPETLWSLLESGKNTMEEVSSLFTITDEKMTDLAARFPFPVSISMTTGRILASETR